MPEFSKPWFADYKVLGVPESLQPYPVRPVYELLDEAAVKYPKMGYIQLGLKMLYPEAKDKADRLANALAELGVKKGDRVVTLLPTSLQYVLSDYGISKAGGVQVPCSFLEPPEYLEHKFKESAPKVIISMEEYYHEGLDDLRANAGVEHVILTKLEDYSSQTPEHGQLPPGYQWLTEVIDSHPPQPPRVELDCENDLETLLFTGGTTGLPKGVMLSHANVITNPLQVGWVMGRMNRILRGNIAAVLAMPFFHAMGHMVSHTCTEWGFMQLLVPDARDAKAMADMIKEHHPVLAIGVPTQFMKMMDEEVKNAGLIGMSGSAAIPPEMQERYEEKVGGQLMEAYGLSEMTTCSHFNSSAIIRLFGGPKVVTISSALFKLPGVEALNVPLLRLLGYQRVGQLFAFVFRTRS
ncbi:MAG: AMP-binding protein, partial [Candidatus Geothermincolia bacterium]